MSGCWGGLRPNGQTYSVAALPALVSVDDWVMVRRFRSSNSRLITPSLTAVYWCLLGNKYSFYHEQIKLSLDFVSILSNLNTIVLSVFRHLPCARQH